VVAAARPLGGGVQADSSEVCHWASKVSEIPCHGLGESDQFFEQFAGRGEGNDQALPFELDAGGQTREGEALRRSGEGNGDLPGALFAAQLSQDSRDPSAARVFFLVGSVAARSAKKRCRAERSIAKFVPIHSAPI
jgi:hypothetical protein